MRGFSFWVGIAVTAIAAAGGALFAAPTAAQSKKLQAADAALTKTANQYKAGKFDASAESMQAARKLILELKDAKDLTRPVARLVARLKQAHALLEIEGLSLPPLDLPAEIAGADLSGSKTPAKSAAKGGTPKGGPKAGEASFVRQVVPILAAKCGGCHMRDAKGRFSMATFAALERGNRDGKVVLPGKPDGSRLIEVIASGDMPRGGGKVAESELAILKKWIAEGAKFDGQNPAQPLLELAPNVKPEMPPPLTVEAATGKESVHFAKEIAPLLVAQCFDCHGPGRRDGGGLSLETFAGLLRGGESGAAITPGKPAESLLVKKLKGTAGARMPLRRAALNPESIAKIETWIAEGGKFDGADANESLEMVAAVAKAQGASVDELNAERARLAATNWRLALPDEKPLQVETKNFLVLGNLDQADMKALGDAAEKQAADVARMLKAPEGKVLSKGRITLFAFRRRIDYTEWQQVEKREIPKDSQGHWRYTVVDAYACVLPAAGGEYGLGPLLAEPIAGLHVASLGKTPRWFAVGVGRNVAARLDPKDARVRSWDAQAVDAWRAAGGTDGFLNGSLAPERNDLLSYAFVRSLMSNGGRFSGLMAQIRQGADFNKTFARQYGGTPQQLLGVGQSRSGAGRGR